MATLSIECKLFDPVRITTAIRADRFIIDTWFATGLIARSLYEQLSGVEVIGTGKLSLSSGMTVDRPRVRVGLQINNIRAMPIEFFIVDDGPAPLLLGSDFLKLLFSVGQQTVAHAGLSQSADVIIESPGRYAPESVGIRLIPTSDSIDALQLERFLRSIRAIHNIGVLAHSGLHQHDDWQDTNREDAKRQAVRRTIETDGSLYDENTLTITWIEAGSIWLSLGSGAKSALSWLSQIFEKSMDARLRATIAAASSAEEEAAIKHMTRDEIARAKNWEQRRLSAKQIKEAREEWRKTVLGEVDFRLKLSEQIHDPVVREEAELAIQKAIAELAASDFMPLIEHIPTIPAAERDTLPARKQMRGDE